MDRDDVIKCTWLLINLGSYVGHNSERTNFIFLLLKTSKGEVGPFIKRDRRHAAGLLIMPKLHRKLTLLSLTTASDVIKFNFIL